MAALDTSTKNITYYISYTLSSGEETAAHIHGFAAKGLDAPVIYTLPTDLHSRVWKYANEGVWTYRKEGVWMYGNEPDVPALELNFGRGLTYVNIHTASKPGGEIRGQLEPRPALQPTYSLVAQLTPASVAGQPSDADAHGDALMNLNTETGRVDYFVDNENRNRLDNGTKAWVYGFSPPGVNSGVMPPMHEIRSSGSMIVEPMQMIGFIDGMTYLEFHTEMHPNGLIRGQLRDVSRPYTIVKPGSAGGSTTVDGVSGVSFPTGSMPEVVGVSAETRDPLDKPPQGRVAYTSELHVDLVPRRAPTGPVVFTLAGTSGARREYGSTHSNKDYSRASLYWWNSQTLAWIEAKGTSFDTERDVSMVTLAPEVLSNPAFGWRLVGLRSATGASSGVPGLLSPSATNTSSGASGMLSPSFLCAPLLLATLSVIILDG